MDVGTAKEGYSLQPWALSLLDIRGIVDTVLLRLRPVLATALAPPSSYALKKVTKEIDFK